MKKTAALACLFLCLMPSMVKAEEPDHWKQGDYNLQLPAEEAWQDRIVSEVKVNDDELLQVVGQGLETSIPTDLLPGSKAEFAASKIKLWDEADKGIGNNGNCFQRITLSSLGRR